MTERLADVALLSGHIVIGGSESARTRMGRAALDDMAFVDRNDGAVVPVRGAMEFSKAKTVWRLGHFAGLTATICPGVKTVPGREQITPAEHPRVCWARAGRTRPPVAGVGS